MNTIKHPALALAVLVLVLFATSSSAQEETAGEKLSALMEQYFQGMLDLHPLLGTGIGDHQHDDRLEVDISPDHRRRTRGLHEQTLASLEAIQRSELSHDLQLHYDVFAYELKTEIASLRFPTHLLPVSPGFSLPSRFPSLASGRGDQLFVTVEDYDRFLSRVPGFVAWVEQAMLNLQEGKNKGIVHPESVVHQYLPELEAQFRPPLEDTLFWGPIDNMPEDFSKEDQERLERAYRHAIEKEIRPIYRRYHQFLKKQYLPHCRSTISLSDVPGGKDWYRFLIRYYTTMDMDPDEIFDLGMAEVERLNKEFERLIAKIGFQGTTGQFHHTVLTDDRLYYNDPELVLAEYRKLERVVRPRLPELFSFIPSAGFEVRQIEAYRAASTPGAFYHPGSPDGERPGVFYVRASGRYPKTEVIPLFLHEALPGHHFQLATIRERPDLPRVLQFAYAGAYNEGWAHYAESLGHELGFYDDPLREYGHLVFDWGRANHLVADIGIHFRGWTRKQAERFFQKNGLTWALDEIDRYTAHPGQALSYKIGGLKVMELRERAEENLGGSFDLKDFHHQILADGPMPLPILESKIDDWIRSSSATQANGTLSE